MMCRICKDECTCVVIRTKGILSGAYRVRGTRMFASTILLLLWQRPKPATFKGIVKIYPSLTVDLLRDVACWLEEHRNLVWKEMLYDELAETRTHMREAAHLAIEGDLKRQEFVNIVAGQARRCFTLEMEGADADSE